MRKFGCVKIVQLSVLIVLAAAGMLMLLNTNLKQYIFSNRDTTLLFLLIWIVIVVNFVFILVDFIILAHVKMDVNELYEAAYADSLSGIPNRFSCDVIIEKYIDKELPRSICCIMLELTNLSEINSYYGHKSGNYVVKEFSKILTVASQATCFVGRNGGNKFLVIMEKCNQDKMDRFLEEVDKKVAKFNQDKMDRLLENADTNAAKFDQNKAQVVVEYCVGIAWNKQEQLTSINQLVSLANKRIHDR